MAKQVYYDDEARRRILDGAKTLYEAVKVSMGPKGRNVVISKSYGGPDISHDGVSIAKAIDLPQDPTKEETWGLDVGAQLLKDAASKTNDMVGDGTTATTVLAYHILEEANKLITAGHNPMELHKGLEAAAKEVLSKIDGLTEQIGDNKERIAEVATISAGSEEIGKLIAEVIAKVGKEGVVTVEESQGLETESEVVEGFTMDKGYASPYLVTDPTRMEAVYDKPSILITDKKIASVQDLLPLLEKLAAAGKKDLVIIAEDVEGEALATLILNKLKGVFNTLAIKAPAFGDRRKAILEDIAILTGATVLSEELGQSFETAELDILGSARKVIADKDNSTIIEGAGQPSEIEERIKQIKAQIESATSEYEKENMEKRLAALQGKVAVIRVGGATETEINEKKYRVDDAVAATKAAVAEGIVPGGAVAYVDLAKEIKQDESSISDSMTAGWVILKKALQQPFRMLMANSGLNAEEKLAKVLEAANGMGFNVNDANKLVNLKDAGIVDPALVTRQVIQNAVSVAGTAMTMGALVVDIPEEDKGAGAAAGMGGGMGMM